VAVSHGEKGGPGEPMEPTTDSEPDAPKQRLRVAYLLARGHKFRRILTDKDAVDEGHSFSKLARACGCSKARVSQIVDLTLLNYSIQEEILAMAKGKGREPITEHDLREVVRVLEPVEQQARWEELLRRKRSESTSDS
jgi:hypothetical protein